jgi:hypothetical protein
MKAAARLGCPYVPAYLLTCCSSWPTPASTMGQPAAWRMVRRLARRAELDGAGESDRTRCESHSSLELEKPAYRSRMCKMLLVMRIHARHVVTTGVALSRSSCSYAVTAW